MMWKSALAILFLLFLGVQEAAAQCVTPPTVTAMTFGNYTGTLLDGTSTVTVNCLYGIAYAVGLDAGKGVGATTTTRYMTGPNGAKLAYQIFQNSARTTNWGNNKGVDTVAGSGVDTPQNIATYSWVEAGQYVAPGTYTDTITAYLYYYELLVGNTYSTATFTVTATIVKNCSVTATTLAFGNYSAGVVKNATSTITVTCTNTTTYSVGLNAGLGNGATDTNRKMQYGTNMLDYALYQDSAYSINWGSNVGVSTEAGTGTGVAQPLTVYGQIAAGQFVTPGSYTDTITATVTY
jgi:spore coat protein U-like protein